ncbi:MAG TPA: integration host factor subunit alpha [Candidatus Polarisedimenticolia bacterium]|nr:integration host factor subunit alpha [Candidatus Polarisedimenticolia bacterium]
MTKADLVDVVYRIHGGLSRKESADIVERLIDSIKRVLLNGGKVQISGFGCFEIVTRRPRKGRNPQTGEVIAIDARHSLVFRPSKILVETLN